MIKSILSPLVLIPILLVIVVLKLVWCVGMIILGLGTLIATLCHEAGMQLALLSARFGSNGFAILSFVAWLER